MSSAKLKILSILLLFSVACYAQKNKVVQSSGLSKTVIPSKREYSITDSLLVFMLVGACKNRSLLSYIKKKTADDHAAINEQDKPALLTMHGNVLYNFNYRSYIDTPFAQSDMIQHTVQTFINGDIVDRYPFRSILTYRNSNSPYFSNSSSVSIQYRQSDMIEKVKSDLRRDAVNSFDKNLLISPSEKYQKGQAAGLKDSSLKYIKKGLYQEFDSLYSVYATKRKNLEALEKKSNKESILQSIIEAREAKFFAKKRHEADSIAASNNFKKSFDSLTAKINGKQFLKKDTIAKALINADSIVAKKQKAEDSITTLRKEVADAEKKVLQFQKHINDSVLSLKKKINQLNSSTSVTEYIDKNDTTERNHLSRGQKFLLSINQIGIGRSWVNYTDLTVQNVSLNGFNIEMNPGNLYIAGAIGSVNSQFRDFILNNNTSPRQSVKLFRVGIGKKDKGNIIFTMYNGQRALLNTAGIGDSAATQAVVGTSLAATKIVSKNTSLTAEFARSSYTDAYAPAQPSKSLVDRAFNLKMRASQAWEIKFKSIYPLTNTKIDGNYRQMGEAFQSFTVYATNVKQEAYLLHANQLLWEKKLSIDASVRKNDFNSPLTAPGYSNSAVFKSLQASLSMPHYPFVSLGYYPSSQLFVGSNNIVYQSWYSTFNAIINYTYKLAKLNMSTNAVYTKFYNHQVDSSFIYFNASTFSFNHTVYLNPFTFQANYTNTNQLDIHLLTLEPVATYQYKALLTVSGSVKWSRLNSEQTLWGGTASMGIVLKNLGTVQLHYDKVYLPSYNRTLMPVDMGRLTFNKIF